MSERKSNRDIRRDYHELLKSWQWRQFSETQIEKANFECWACEGAKRQDLQVHHLVYRDVMPWEYDDHEVRVLCRDCHKAIHLVADLVWVELLRFQPSELEVILKRAKCSNKTEPLSSVPNNINDIFRGIYGAKLKSEESDYD